MPKISLRSKLVKNMSNSLTCNDRQMMTCKQNTIVDTKNRTKKNHNMNIN